MTLTRNEFTNFKQDYDIYGTHTEDDKYSNEHTVKDDTPKATINVMWNPLNDAAAIAEYGKDIKKMFYCILYDDPGLAYNDVVTIRGEDYEVVGLKYYNTHTRVEVSKKKA